MAAGIAEVGVITKGIRLEAHSRCLGCFFGDEMLLRGNGLLDRWFVSGKLCVSHGRTGLGARYKTIYGDVTTCSSKHPWLGMAECCRGCKHDEVTQSHTKYI